MVEIEYETVETIDVAELSAFYGRQHHRTTRSQEKLSRMVENSFRFVTARQGGRLVGIARCLTDGLVGYLAECKLDPELQGPGAVTRTDGRVEHDRDGVAKTMAEHMIDALAESGVEEVHTMAYGTEVDFCEELGFRKSPGMVALRLGVDSPVEVETASGVVH
jgi:hypothetical protein